MDAKSWPCSQNVVCLPISYQGDNQPIQLLRHNDANVSVMPDGWCKRVRPSEWALRVRSHVRFVRNPHGLLHFWLVTFQQEWSHGVHGGAVRPANQAKKLPQPRCQNWAAAAETWFAKLPLDYMLHNRFPWKRSGRRSITGIYKIGNINEIRLKNFLVPYVTWTYGKVFFLTNSK